MSMPYLRKIILPICVGAYHEFGKNVDTLPEQLCGKHTQYYYRFFSVKALVDSLTGRRPYSRSSPCTVKTSQRFVDSSICTVRLPNKIPAELRAAIINFNGTIIAPTLSMLSPAFLGKFYTNFIDCAMFYNTAVAQILKLEGKWRLRKKVKQVQWS